MAYGKKYTITFRDRRDIRWKAHIYKNNYASTIYGLQCSSEPLTFEMRSSGDVFDPIKITEATLNVVVSGVDFGGDADEERIQEFKTAKIFDFYLEVEKESSVGSGVYGTFYHGSFITDIYTEPYDQLPYSISLKFTDLGDLEFIEYKETVDLFYKNLNQLSTQIYNAVKPLPYVHNLVEILNIFPNEVTEADSTSSLQSIYHNVTAYVTFDYDKKRAIGESCLSVLRRICQSFGCRFVQYEGSLWMMVRINEMTSPVDSPIKYITLSGVNYATVLTNGTSTFNKTIDNTESNGIAKSAGAELSLESLVDTLVYMFKNQEPVRNGSDIIFNYRMDKGFYEPNATNSLANYWKLHTSLDNAGQNTSATQDSDESLITTSGAIVNISKQSFAFLPQAISSGRTASQGGATGQTFSSYDKYYVSAFNPTTDGNTYLAQEYVQIVTTDSLRIKLKGRYLFRRTYASIIADGPITATQRFMISIKDQNIGTVWYLKKTGGGSYIWWSSPTVASISMIMSSSGQNSVGYDLHDNPFDFEIDIDSLPFNGIAEYFEFRLFVPLTSKYDNTNHRIDTAVYDDISAQYISDNQLADQIIVQENNLSYSPKKLVERKYEVTHGDAPFKYCLGALYAPNQTTLTTQWHRRDEIDTRSFAQHFVDTFFLIYSDYNRKLNIDIYAYIDSFKRILLHNIIYIIDGFNFRVKESIYSCQLIEITEKATPIVDPIYPAGIKNAPLLPNPGKPPKVKAKPNGIISANTSNAGVMGKETITTQTETPGNYPG